MNILNILNYIATEKKIRKFSKNRKQKIKFFNSSNNFHFEKISCIICNNNKFINLLNYDRYSLLQKTCYCKNCGLIQSNPRMTKESYKKFYESDLYRDIYNDIDQEKYIENKFTQPEKHNNDTYNIFKIVNSLKKINNNTNVLEIGSHAGYNLLSFKNNNAQVLGVDYSTEGIEIGKKYGITLTQGDSGIVKGKFDVILLCHVIEHFTDPFDELKKIRKLLKEDGLLYISLPNIENFGLDHFQNAHTYYFRKEEFLYLLNSSFFELIDFGISQEIHMYGVFKIKESSNNTFDIKNNRIKTDLIIKNYYRKLLKKIIF